MRGMEHARYKHTRFVGFYTISRFLYTMKHLDNHDIVTPR
jgi:hypothetical protein